MTVKCKENFDHITGTLIFWVSTRPTRKQPLYLSFTDKFNLGSDNCKFVSYFVNRVNSTIFNWRKFRWTFHMFINGCSETILRSQNHHMIHIIERTCQMCNLCNNRSFTDHELFVNILSYHTNLGSTNDCGCIWLGIIPTHSPTGLMIRYQLTIQTQHSVLFLSPKKCCENI